ncbi:MBOAT family O-acyltransferase [Marinicella meishanensis]|uniref:MBOAT family O-acyltransferase n=1 Tax=Marinicella meishanensis TaxID=2873263 RepID=UPI001CBC5497|nr:MBOAT family O-acyltransferase [Marinicella sp. NBU2979]
MLFNSLSFFVFLVVVLVVSAILRRLHKGSELWFLVFASAYFYGQWNWSYLILIYITIVCDFILGLKYFRSDQPHKFLYLSLTVNLGILGIFKYLNFLVDSSNAVLQGAGFSYAIPGVELLLPVGISFYTFQSMSYMIDIHRGQLQPRTRFVDYALFVSFFPQLVAGPIVRASEFFKQLDEKRHFSFAMAQSGLLLIMLGLVKKVVFADNLALFVDPVFNNPQGYSGMMNLLAVYAFAFQIYFDFSGYSDIAIGVAKLLGFTFPRNFMHPYVSLSFQDFWRRWHMTLSRWLRDYLYISLGGNRKGAYKTMRNLFLTMFLGGLWHGASWNFAIWGVLHGVYLAVERFNSKFQWIVLNNKHLIFRLLKWLLVFHLVCFAWIFFRAADFTDSATMIHHIFTLHGEFKFTTNNTIPILVIALLPLLHLLQAKLDLFEKSSTLKTAPYVTLQCLLAIVLYLFSSQNTGSFMYFQF